MKKISFIVLTYNSGKYLKLCLEGIIRNMALGDELIVIDNNSTDNTKKILNEYINVKGIRVFFLDRNIFISDGRNYGAKLAKNNLLAFIDSDIILNDNVINKTRKSIKKNDAVIGLYYEHGAGFNWYVEAIREIYAAKRKAKFKKEINYRNFTTFSGGLCIIKKSIYLEYMGYNNAFDSFPSEDIDLELRMIRDHRKIIFDKNFLANHYKEYLTFKGLIKKYYRSGIAAIYLLKLSIKEKYLIPFNNQWPYLPIILPVEFGLLIVNNMWSFALLLILICYRVFPILFCKNISFKRKIATILLRVILDIVMIYSMFRNLFIKISCNEKKFNLEYQNENN